MKITRVRYVNSYGEWSGSRLIIQICSKNVSYLHIWSDNVNSLLKSHTRRAGKNLIHHRHFWHAFKQELFILIWASINIMIENGCLLHRRWEEKNLLRISREREKGKKLKRKQKISSITAIWNWKYAGIFCSFLSRQSNNKKIQCVFSVAFNSL